MNMSRQQMLTIYYQDVNHLVNRAKKCGLNDSKVEEIFADCFDILKREKNETKNSIAPNQKSECTKNRLGTFYIRVFGIFISALAFAIFIYILLNVHQPTASLVLRNIQGLIYPGFKILRFLSVPIIKRFPSLTDLYDESCLLENPYFYVHGMECWPCQNVFYVGNLTEPLNQSMYLYGIPYVTRTSHPPVPYTSFKHLYTMNREVLDRESSSIKSTPYKITKLKDVFDLNIEDLGSDIHISWRINKMLPARIIRNLFRRHESLPERSGQSVERYIMIDGAKAQPYSLPNTECSFISVRQGSGQRTIVLKPSLECSQDCRTVSINLNPSDTLWYNWWYWRPVSLPTDNATEISITYISSYC